MNIKCFFGFHKFSNKLETQSTVLFGIVKKCTCDLCGAVYIATFNEGVDFDTIDKDIMTKHILLKGYKTSKQKDNYEMV